ncbi:hypothetical protein, partial [Leekyejoonella antrihumi]|uniref:hypothetical protein n=1 Tax=Leekyejoonella antrihumi TaxID=1660198 RepID=UPI001C9432C6
SVEVSFVAVVISDMLIVHHSRSRHLGGVSWRFKNTEFEIDPQSTPVTALCHVEGSGRESFL